MLEVRTMRAGELDGVAEISDGAFIEVIAKLSGQRLERPFFPLEGLGLRLEADPEGCLVATDGGVLAGSLFSVARGTLAWFGPLAVATGRQDKGVGQALVKECVSRWSLRGVRLMGLETFPNSSFHLHLYSKFGFRPAWVGFQVRKQLDAPPAGPPAEPAPPLQHPMVPLPDLGYLYPGFDPTAEVRAILNRKAGRVFATDRSLAIVLLADSFHVTAADAFVPLLVAPAREAFLSLVAASEDAARAAGKKSIAIRLSGSSWGRVPGARRARLPSGLVGAADEGRGEPRLRSRRLVLRRLALMSIESIDDRVHLVLDSFVTPGHEDLVSSQWAAVSASKSSP